MPQSLSPKDAAQATKDEVAAIQASMAAFRPQSAEAYAAPPPATAIPPAWAIAAFGEPQPTETQKAQAQASEQSSELMDKERQAYDELVAKQQQELAQLVQQQQQERQQLAQQQSDALKQAREADSAKDPKPDKTPNIPGTPS